MTRPDEPTATGAEPAASDAPPRDVPGSVPGLVHNMLHGASAGPTVQAGSISGGVHFHTAATAPGAPRQLPPPPAHLVGREVELAAIDRLASRPRTGPALIVLGGVAGVGKSTVAVGWAQRAADRFPDGQLYLSLGALDPAGPVSPGEALGQALRSLGVAADRVPRTTAEQATLFRTVTAGRSLLMLLDDAVSAAQVRPLLPASPACTVLVTSRWQLGGLLHDGAGFLILEPLTERAAAALLARNIGAERAGADPAATMRLAQLCGGLPIALTVACARLVTRPSWPVRRVVDDLTDEQGRLRALTGREDVSVQGAFDLSYQSLPAAVAVCYRALGLLPGPDFGPSVVAAALVTPPAEATRLLECLLEANLLTETAEDRYQMHDLVRLHARQHATTDPDQPATRRRILGWYLAGALAADRVLTPYRRRDRHDESVLDGPGAVGHADRPAALAWLERERAGLVAAVGDAAGDEPLLAWRIADAMWPLFHYHRHHSDRMRVDRIAVDCARKLDDADLEARMLRRWAFAHVDVGELDRADELFARALNRYERIGDAYGMSAAAEGLGVVALRQGRHAAATEYFQRQLRQARQLGERRRCGLALLNLGVVDNDAGRHDAAVRRLREAAAALAEPGLDPYNAARVGIELGRALGRLGDHETARRELGSALASMRGIGSPRGQAQAWHRLGELAAARHDVVAARVHLAAALEVYRDLADVEVAEVSSLLRGLAA